MNIRPYKETDREEVIKLWKEVFPDNPPHCDPGNDIDMKMTVQPDLLLVGEIDGEVISTVMGGFEGHRGWIYYLAVREKHRGSGYGKSMITEAEHRLRKLGCIKINLMVRISNSEVVGFYESIGYNKEELICMSKRLV